MRSVELLPLLFALLAVFSGSHFLQPILNGGPYPTQRMGIVSATLTGTEDLAHVALRAASLVNVGRQGDNVNAQRK